MQFFLLASLTLLVLPGESVDLTCPTGPINFNRPSGQFPSTGGLTQFPKNYGCAIDFEIPNGLVVKFIVQTNAVANSGDSITIRDSVSTLYEFSAGQSVFYAPANSSRLWIVTKTDSASFFFSWVYVDITTYKKNENRIGSIMKLDLTPLNYYTFSSIYGPVTYHASNVNREFDVNLGSIFVYDGDDLSAPFIGNLMNLITANGFAKSTGKSLTLVNLYAYNTKSYGIANDYAAIKDYAKYSFWILSADKQFLGTGDSSPSSKSAITFYSIDSPETYITSILVVNKGINGQTAAFQPLTPSHYQNAVLTYDAKDNNDPYFPQQILSNTFTMVFSNCEVDLRMQTGPYADWKKPFAGRRGTILSPTVWDPTASPAYNVNFTSGDMYSYSFDVQSVVIGTPGENIRLEVGSPFSSTPAVVQFSQTSVNTGTKVANGTYLSTVYTGTNPASNFRMTFAIDVCDPSTATSASTASSSQTVAQISTSTASPGLQTTTKSAQQGITLLASVFIMIKALVY